LDNTFIKYWITPFSNIEKTFFKRWTILLPNVRQNPCQTLDNTFAKRLENHGKALLKEYRFVLFLSDIE